jgi:hypothetical protein
MAAKTAEQKAAEAAQKEQEEVAKLTDELAALGVTKEAGLGVVAPLKGDEDSKALKEILKTAKKQPREDDNTDDSGEIKVKFRDHKGETVERVFSLAVHGKEYKALAAEFRETNAPRLVK